MSTTDRLRELHGVSKEPLVKRQVLIKGVPFDEDFIFDLIQVKLASGTKKTIPLFSEAKDLYKQEHPRSHRPRFCKSIDNNVRTFISIVGDFPIDELKFKHGTLYRDVMLERGAKTVSVRNHFTQFNAVLNMAYRYFDMDKFSPFRKIPIRDFGQDSPVIPLITLGQLQVIKDYLMQGNHVDHFIALILLNTGMRLSEPIFAMRKDLVLDHYIPHLWVRANQLTDRKTKSSIRCVPLVGASLYAATELAKISDGLNSDWLVPKYAFEDGNSRASLRLKLLLRPHDFSSKLFRHAFIDRMRAVSDIPMRLGECIMGHTVKSSQYENYGSVGFTLEQKLQAIRRIEV
jgi:integrase